MTGTPPVRNTDLGYLETGFEIGSDCTTPWTQSCTATWRLLPRHIGIILPIFLSVERLVEESMILFHIPLAEAHLGSVSRFSLYN